jgi:hypothetical protein
MGRHQNQAVKRARERNKKLKAEDKRAKRENRKKLGQDGPEEHRPSASEDSSLPTGKPGEAASGEGPAGLGP